MNPVNNTPQNNNPAQPPASATKLVTSAQFTAPTTPPQSNNSKLPSWVKPLYIVIAVCFVIIAVILIWLFAFNRGTITGLSMKPAPTSKTAPTATTVAGNILFQGFASSEAYLIIAERVQGKGEYKSVVTGIVPKTGAIPWQWKDAVAGTNYEIQAQLKERGNVIEISTSNIISAPASNVNLVLVSNKQPPTPSPAQISGTTNINGYIPQAATVTITANTTSTSGATTIASVPAVDDSAWTWNNAISGTNYTLNAQLYDVNNNPIASPSTINITAPSSGIKFNINSNVQPPAPSITGLSGNVTINGSIPSSSNLTIGTRVTGTSSFTQVSNLAASNSVTWSWQQAQSGTSYDVQAYLWSNNKPYAQSQILTETAPSNGNNLIINAQQSTSAPGSNTMNVSCGGSQGGSYQATINYNTQANLSNASSYNIIVTLASQGSQVLNTTVSPPNSTHSQSLTTTYIFTPGATYYAQYAYATSGSNYSPLSPAIQFSCQ